ncbi:hypothetical protein [Halomonas heilongjiangensis]|uniref:Uncharacterized protein n=1 Tax=Halomonas heilongjiangensis TaxID=1387883 RepID=A0A2N7THR0_9GAMM|nr:hypothetical protein [Halomonas heilongjiangensis]PMR67713.1 hypothetical protein C1H66_18375 [Halomonas heilongjiangensis]PXX87588.1 hypothetical protein CR158_17420 [Halomonas heilongjiangensis]
MRGSVVLGGAITVGLALSGPLANSAKADELTGMVEAIRVAVERFADVNVALAEGYIPDPSGECVMAGAHGLPAELGGMGIHYLHPGLLGITATEPRVDGTGTHTDFLQPAILLYEPQPDGTLALVGVENLVFQKAWEEAGHTEPPRFAGRSWDYMANDPDTTLDEAHGFEPHYDQHIWFLDNSNGRLEPFNPAVICAHHPH